MCAAVVSAASSDPVTISQSGQAAAQASSRMPFVASTLRPAGRERAVRVPHTVINEQYWPAMRASSEGSSAGALAACVAAQCVPFECRRWLCVPCVGGASGAGEAGGSGLCARRWCGGAEVGGGISRQQRPSDYQSVWSGCGAGLQSSAIRGIDIATRRSWESRARATYCHQ